MDDSIAHANRCLPLLMANQAGWWVLSRGTHKVLWKHDHKHIGDVEIESTFQEPPISHFGDGIITWRIPYLFRTDPGWQILMRGPSNWPKAGVTPLEGLIETDWAIQPAFYSVKLTSREEIVWEDGEPICQIVPIRCADLEETQTQMVDITQEEELREQYYAFSRSRSEFNQTRTDERLWQKHYFRGQTEEGAKMAEGHRTKLQLRGFE